MDAGLAAMCAADRGFLTWVATRAAMPVEALWERLIGTVHDGPGTRLEGGRLVTLDLSVIGPALRDAVGEAAMLSPPLYGLDHLTYLDCSGVGFDRLDVSGLPRLTELRCADNRLRHLDLGPAGLEVLDCSGNQLMVLDPRPCPELRVLRCSGNGLGALVLAEGTALTHLDCSRNQIMVLDLGEQPRLTVLRCFQNALVRLSVASAPALVHLDASENELPAVDLPVLPALQVLALGINWLSEVPVRGALALRELSIERNYVDALDLRTHAALQRVEASYNQLAVLALGVHPALQVLDVAHNRLGALALGGAAALEVLEVQGNALSVLDLTGLQQLCALDCTGNTLAVLSPRDAPRLARLSCQDNRIATLDVRGNGELFRLWSGEADVHATPRQRRRIPTLRLAAGLPEHEDPERMDAFELHEAALQARGRGSEERLLQLARHPRCDLGTALLIYWTGAPHYYLQYASGDELVEYKRVGWEVLRAIEDRVERGDFQTAEIWFDPHHDKQTRSVRGVDWTVDDRLLRSPQCRSIPPWMVRATSAAPVP